MCFERTGMVYIHTLKANDYKIIERNFLLRVGSTTRIPVQNIDLNSNCPCFSEQYFVSSSLGLTAAPPASSRTPLLILDSAHNQRNYSIQISQNWWVREKNPSTYHSIWGNGVGLRCIFKQTVCSVRLRMAGYGAG